MLQVFSVVLDHSLSFLTLIYSLGCPVILKGKIIINFWVINYSFAEEVELILRDRLSPDDASFNGAPLTSKHHIPAF